MDTSLGLKPGWANSSQVIARAAWSGAVALGISPRAAEIDAATSRGGGSSMQVNLCLLNGLLRCAKVLLESARVC